MKKINLKGVPLIFIYSTIKDQLVFQKSLRVDERTIMVFIYRKFKEKNSFFKLLSFNFVGVAHAEELQYLFPIGKWLFLSAVPTENDLKIRDLMTQMWVNFASYG